MTTKCLPKRQNLKKNQPKISFFTTSEKENPWSEDETDTGTTTEANEPIEVDDDVSHKASENKEQGKFQSHWVSLYTWLTYDKDTNKMYCSKCISIGANNTMTAGCDNFKTSSLTIGMQLVQITRFIASKIAANRFRARRPPYPGLMAHYFDDDGPSAHHLQKLG
jgi:hypothetical protein